MKQFRLTALVLAGAMTLSLLAACGGKQPDPTPEVSETPAVESAEATPTAQPEESVPATETAPAEESAPAAETATPAPTKAPETAKPTEKPAEPTPEPEPEVSVTAADVYAKVSAVAGGNSMSDMGFVLEEFYNLSASDLEDYAFYMPDMSTTLEEIFIAKVKSGKMDAVKAACQSRQQGLKEESDFYPTTAAYIDSYKIVTNGDWILFVVVEKPDAAVKAFNDCTK